MPDQKSTSEKKPTSDTPEKKSTPEKKATPKKDTGPLSGKDVREILEEHGVGLSVVESKKVAEALGKKIK